MTAKAAIAAVCRVLAGAGAGVGALSPEAFRQAKFDRGEVTADFWKLLYYLLKLVSENKNCAVTDLGHQIEYVKAAVCYYGYGFLDFYQLPADGSRGSRDLLLVFSWLLQKIHLFEKLLEQQRLRVEDQVPLCTCRQAAAVRPTEKSDSPAGEHAVGMDVRYLQWLQGKLRFRWKCLHSAQQERCATLHKIHLYTRGCRSGQSFSHLFATETRLIRDPERCSEFVQLLERENMRLEAYLEWRQLEPLFWQWMESVLAAKLQDTQNPLDANSIASTAHSPNLSGDHVDRVTFREMDNLSSEILKLQMKLQDGQKTKIKTMLPVPLSYSSLLCLRTDACDGLSPGRFRKSPGRGAQVDHWSGSGVRSFLNILMEEAPKERVEAALDEGVQQLQADICQLVVTAQDPSPSPVEIQHRGLDSSSVAEHRSCSHQCNFQFNFTIPEGGSEDPAVTPPAQGVVSSCPGDSGTAQQGRSGFTSDCLPATGEERPLCSGAVSQHAEFKFNFAIPEAGADVNRTGESTADPAQSQQLENVGSTASKSTRKKKKRNRTQNTKPQAGIRKDPEQPSQNSRGEERNSMGLSPEEQLQREVDWCIEQLKLGMQSQKNTKKRGEEAARALCTLHSKRAPLVKKRQLMRSMFGDYRKKMEEERQKQFRLMLTATKSASIKPVKEQTKSKVLGKIATKSPKVGAVPASDSMSPEKITVGSGEPAPFRFNFF